MLVGFAASSRTLRQTLLFIYKLVGKNYFMKTKAILITLLILNSPILFAQDGALDTTFANNGIFSTYWNFFSGYQLLLDLSVDNSNSIYISGNVTNSNGSTSVKLIKLLPDGELDTTFGDAGFATIHYSPRWFVSKTIILESGKIALVGSITSNLNDIIVVRLNSDGSIDQSFGNNGRFIYDGGHGSDQAFAIVEQDSKLIIGGYVTNKIRPSWAYSSYSLIRLTADGVLDTTFGNNGHAEFPNVGEWQEIKDLLIDDSGNIVVCGYRGDVSAPYYNRDDPTILKLNDNGILDMNFGDNGVLEIPYGEIDIAESIQYIENSYYITGQIRNVDNQQFDVFIVKTDQNGALDNSFNNDGKLVIDDEGGLYQGGYSSIIQNDNKLIVGGSYRNPFIGTPVFEIRFHRLTSSGNLDPEFGDNGVGHFDLDAPQINTHALSRQFDNKFLSLGLDNNNHILLTRHNINQALFTNDESFDSGVFKVYPNPTKGELNVSSLDESGYKALIFNTLGKLTDKFNFSNSMNKIDISHLKPGVYFIKLTSESANTVKKIVVK
jgi:uncharacterized delta-60 repeat protein